MEETRRKCKFFGYCKDYNAFRIYVPVQRKVEINMDVMFDEYAAFGKERGLPPPPPTKKKNDDMDILDGDIVDDPMEPMDPSDPPPCDPPAKKRPIWLRDTL